MALLVVFFVPSVSIDSETKPGQQHVPLFSFTDPDHYLIQSWVSDEGGSAALDAVFLLLAVLNIVLNFAICVGWILFKSEFVVARDFYKQWFGSHPIPS